MWGGLTPPELAACVSALCYESRQSDDAGAAEAAARRVREALGEMVRALGPSSTRSSTTTAWRSCASPTSASRGPRTAGRPGARLEAVLREADLAAGDFVRWCKQLVDLLGQIADAAGVLGRRTPSCATRPSRPIDGVMRGVVSFTSVA